MTLDEVTSLYEVASICTISRELVEEGPVDDFTVESRALERALGDLAKEGPWHTALRPLRLARWLLHTVPLPSDDKALDLVGRAIEFRIRTRQMLEGASEEVSHRLGVISDILDELARAPHTGLLDATKELLAVDAQKSTIALLHDDAMVAPVRLELAQASRSLSVLTPSVLRFTPPAEAQLVVGASRHFPDWVFNAPRAPIITVLHRASMSDRAVVPTPLGSSRRTVAIRGQRAPGLTSTEFVFEAPGVDWALLHRGAASEQVDSVRARAYLLAGGYSVLLEANDAATVFVVQPQLPASELIGRSSTGAVEPGDFILLREAFGDEDVIVQLADRILKKKAEGLRAQQASWKRKLRMRVDQDGYERALDSLEREGCRARNLARWLGPDAIRTQSESDFYAICRYARITQEEAERTWMAMAQIHRAHIKAGSNVRDLLEKQLAQADLGKLQDTGYARVELAGVDAGSLGVFQVLAKDPGTTTVNPRSLRIATKVRNL